MHVCKLLFKQKYISHNEYEQPASKTTCMKNKKNTEIPEGECRYTQKTQIPVSLSISRGEIEISNHGFQPSLRNHHEGSR